MSSLHHLHLRTSCFFFFPLYYTLSYINCPLFFLLHRHRWIGIHNNTNHDAHTSSVLLHTSVSLLQTDVRRLLCAMLLPPMHSIFAVSHSLLPSLFIHCPTSLWIDYDRPFLQHYFTISCHPSIYIFVRPASFSSHSITPCLTSILSPFLSSSQTRVDKSPSIQQTWLPHLINPIPHLSISTLNWWCTAYFVLCFYHLCIPSLLSTILWFLHYASIAKLFQCNQPYLQHSLTAFK